MLRRMTRRQACGLLFLGALAPVFRSRPAGASVARAVSLAELAKKSVLISFFTPFEASSCWEKLGGTERIVTYTRLEIDDWVSGSPSSGTVEVRTLGGRVGNVAQIVHGEAMLAVGERCLAFIARSRDGVLRVAEFAQGHYPLLDDGRGTLRLRPSPGLGTLLDRAGSALEALVGRSQPEARELIGRALSSAR